MRFSASMTLALGGLLCAGGCAGGEDAAGGAGVLACDDEVVPVLLLGQDGTEHALQDGDDVIFGDGLQVAGSFVSLTLRARGLQAFAESYDVALEGRDTEGVLLAEEHYERRMLCANTGSYQGYLVSPGLHLRFADQSAEVLEGKTVTLRVVIEDPQGTQATAEVTGVLRYWDL